MPSLNAVQTNVIDTINTGPDGLDPSLFSGPNDRIMLGLKAHANTINHARLVAMEDSFPRTRKEIGEASFNALSRDYIETTLTGALDNNGLGSRFAGFLKTNSVPDSVYDLAQIEWAYLKSYHAPEAEPLLLSDLSAFSEAALLLLEITLHPSVQLVALTAPIAKSLDELVGQTPAALLLVRPQAEVLLYPADALLIALLQDAQKNRATLGNLLAISIEQAIEHVPLEPVTHLIDAGALIVIG
jgi:hypothetical protein